MQVKQSEAPTLQVLHGLVQLSQVLVISLQNYPVEQLLSQEPELFKLDLAKHLQLPLKQQPYLPQQPGQVDFKLQKSEMLSGQVNYPSIFVPVGSVMTYLSESQLIVPPLTLILIELPTQLAQQHLKLKLVVVVESEGSRVLLKHRPPYPKYSFVI